MQKEIEHAVDEAIRAIVLLKEEKSMSFIENASQLIAKCFTKGGKLLIAGNGGSLCDAMHFAEELTGQFRYARKALPAIALSDPGHLSCTANDMGFDFVFARAVEAFAKPEDLFIALTTSGNSTNLFKAMLTARKRGLKTISFLGKTGGKLKGVADLEWIVSGFEFSDRIQEAHMTAIHIIIEQVEVLLFQTEPRAICVSS
ncbi:Phosphoheptose isomerase [Candidatus Rhabdochlamydia oedothoracis]|uniref:Phosphoheptose isomerase n=1 Tax=Candidatus Rhabdochlamydia oedothoracis TaxID=2720720 RepID=A0ABX8V7F8_9BACT|nr:MULTISPECIES: SIS domain-containing protein [Rhabdochlamydia]KAG6558914.1 Phosphoheptose isomerase [Candidatus Rhabdochlamydia sp. W815]MCL6756379.1 SIS domain-containing protein [Candidatus Rhabdochlamydia oedothoracis]QYF49385.1 Phosphoheptose isomerase [Candidatus Rhabdochlamydia oedothoracis]